MPGKPSIHKLRTRLAQSEAMPQLTLMALIIGLFAGCLLVIFEELLYVAGVFSQQSLIPAQIFAAVSSVESGYEALPPLVRFLAPVAGALLMIPLIGLCPKNQRSFGIAHVIERLTLERGWLPIRNTIIQFASSFLALLCGFSVGREGPAVHLGAGIGSYLGQLLKLPANTLGVLAGCGSAAAIAALFNTPMAGVLFAMEVVMKEYSLESFIPIMASSVIASVITRNIYDSSIIFQLPSIPHMTFEELSLTVVSAFVIGLLAALFIRINLATSKKKGRHLAQPLLAAGVLMGIMGVSIPETMGIGFDTIQSLLHGETFSIGFLVLLLLAKLVITSVVIGLGIPGGIIGPSLVMGAIAGAALTMIAGQFMPLSNHQMTFYALTGMIAMMAAVLQAPLAALITVLELSQSPEIILPAMIAIVVACLTSSQLCQQQGIFTMQFLAKGLNIRLSPLAQLLNRIGVASLMTETDEAGHTHKQLLEQEIEPIYSIDIQSTAQDALALMDDYQVDRLIVVRQQPHGQQEDCGIITRTRIREEL